MILKLTHPASTRPRHIFLPVPFPDEVFSEIVTEFTDQAVDRQTEVWKRLGYDTRHFLHWPLQKVDGKGRGKLLKVQPKLLEITINRAKQPVMILTNYDVLLLTDEGKRIDRLFRYEIEPVKGIQPGSGELSLIHI